MNLNTLSMKFFFSFFIGTVLWACQSKQVEIPEKSDSLVTTNNGEISGLETETEGVYVYKGIPYAKPPVGDLRWKAPQPLVPSDTVFAADEFGHPCMQSKHAEGEFYQKEFFFDGDPPYNEDCLCLNIWTSAPGMSDKKLPVAVWVHGGGYVAGWGHEIEMDGEAWAERGVILVTFNYRLGIFGFMAHPELTAESENKVSGNYATLDQIAALQWVRDNIAEFGGDPDNITVFGQSAGAYSVKNLVSSELSKHLISKAIIMSGGGVGQNSGVPLLSAESVGEATMAFGTYKSIQEMREASAEEIFNLGRDYGNSIGQWQVYPPNIDGYVSKQSFDDAAKSGVIADIPYMIGFTKDDIPFLANPNDIEIFVGLRSQQGGKVFTYQFARPLPGDDSGAFHSSELWFVFNTLSKSWRPFTDGDYALSETMVDAWTNFAKYSNPNSPGSDIWSPYSDAIQKYMLFKLDAGGKVANEMGESMSSNQ